MNTYKKLQTGEWGATVNQKAVKAGDSIIITKKDGGKKTETVGAVVWKSDDGEKCIVTLKPRGSCRECRGPMVDAPHHRAMGGLCGECAFDEYDM